jgi:hypothetical protein
MATEAREMGNLIGSDKVEAAYGADRQKIVARADARSRGL